MRGLRVLVAALALLVVAPASSSSTAGDGPAAKVRTWKIHYRSHNGKKRTAYVVLPAWYGPRRNPPIPLVISPHGRGVGAKGNAKLWGTLPARGTFAVVNPDGIGRKLPRYSWGYRGHVEDLARMPRIVRRTLPWIRVDRKRVYAFGGSMGGQESLLLLARHPKLLAGVAVFDSVTDFAMQYRRFPKLCAKGCRGPKDVKPLGRRLQALARREVGGRPKEVPRLWAARSPMTYARRIANSCVPLQMWWSVSDRVVIEPQRQSGRLFWELRRINPGAPTRAFVGFWIHTSVMRANKGLPLALFAFGLLPAADASKVPTLHMVRPPKTSATCGTPPYDPTRPVPNPPPPPDDPAPPPPDEPEPLE